MGGGGGNKPRYLLQARPSLQSWGVGRGFVLVPVRKGEKRHSSSPLSDATVQFKPSCLLQKCTDLGCRFGFSLPVLWFCAFPIEGHSKDPAVEL